MTDKTKIIPLRHLFIGRTIGTTGLTAYNISDNIGCEDMEAMTLRSTSR
ncbi:MAG: hypothetical protein WCF70_03390 [Dehalococcoidales bacterium]